MKLSKYLSLPLVIFALSGAQSHGAGVFAGFYHFNGDKAYYPPASEPADETAPGIVAWDESPNQASSASGGDLGGYYGNSNLAVPTVYPGDGYASIRMYDNIGSSQLKFSMTNNTGYSINLSNLYFDAAAASGQFQRYLQVSFVNALGTTPLGIFGSPTTPGQGLISTSPQDFDDFGVNLGGYVMANNETVSFVFSIATSVGNPALGTTLWIDNVAIVPEPSTVMGFGCMVMTSLMFRRRRS